MVTSSQLGKSQNQLDFTTKQPNFSWHGITPLDNNEREEINRRATQLQTTLAGFKVSAQVTRVEIGPSVTCYGLALAPGVKVSQVKGLEADLALALGLPSLRLQIPLPGTSLIGVEVPNTRRRWVTLDEVLASPEFHQFGGHLKLPVGRDSAGRIIVADLARLPHLVVAGVTGSGKSVFLNSLLTAWTTQLYTPSELCLVLIDPKQVELAKFNRVPHLYLPVITALTQSQARAQSHSFDSTGTATTGDHTTPATGPDTHGLLNAITVLGWLVAEMKSRYRRFVTADVSNISAYNRLVERINTTEQNVKAGNQPAPVALEKLPRLVIVIDEIASMMAVINKEAEARVGDYYLKELLNMGRAAGIHLILATQYPSATVLPGEIKSQIPGRLCFVVSREIDSRVVLDTGGAEQLLGRGDGLARLGEATVSMSSPYELPPVDNTHTDATGAGARVVSPNPSSGELVRVQSAFIEDEEISRRLNMLYGAQVSDTKNQEQELSDTIARLAALPLPTFSDMQLDIDEESVGEKEPTDTGDSSANKETTANRRRGRSVAGRLPSATSSAVVMHPHPQLLVVTSAPSSAAPASAASPVTQVTAPREKELEENLTQERRKAEKLEGELAAALADVATLTTQIEQLNQQVATLKNLKVSLDGGNVVMPVGAVLGQLTTSQVEQLASTTTNKHDDLSKQPRHPSGKAPLPQPNPKLEKDKARAEQVFNSVVNQGEQRRSERIDLAIEQLVKRLNKLSKQNRAILLLLERHPGQEFTPADMAVWLGYEATTIANNPPTELIKLKFASRRKAGSPSIYRYKSTFQAYLTTNKDLAGIDPVSILSRLKA